MKNVFVYGILSGIICGIGLISVTLFKDANIAFLIVGYVLYGVCISKCDSKEVLFASILCMVIELILIFIYGIYDYSNRDMENPTMPFLGAYLLVLFPFSVVVETIISVVIHIGKAK